MASLKPLIDEVLALRKVPVSSRNDVSDTDLNVFAAVVAIAGKLDNQEIDGPLAVALTEFAAKIGFLGAGPGRPPLQPLVDAYLVTHPLHPALMKRFGDRVAKGLGVAPAQWGNKWQFRNMQG